MEYPQIQTLASSSTKITRAYIKAMLGWSMQQALGRILK
jgi:hypothetical protein